MLKLFKKNITYLEIPDKTKKEVIKLYKLGLGTTKLSQYLLGEGIEITPNTVYKRLKEWKVNIRPLTKK